MKSEKAKDKLDYNQCHVCNGVLEDGLRVGCDDLVYYAAAIEAIEIAEQEMMENCIDGLCSICVFNDNGICYDPYSLIKGEVCNKGRCAHINKFKEYMK